MANLKVGVGGAWKQVQKVSVGVGGAWKDAWTYLTVTLPGTINCDQLEISPTDSLSTFTLSNAGTYSGSGGVSGTWLTAGSASQCECRLTPTSGTFDGGTINTWENLGTSRTWQELNTTNGTSSESASGTLEIRDATSGTVLATTTLTITANVET